MFAHITLEHLLAAFPHRAVRPIQQQILENLGSHAKAGVTIEVPTGVGKTAVGMAVLSALAKLGVRGLFYASPTKTQVDQVRAKFPHLVRVVTGRADYPCPYYTQAKKPQNVTAAESPCYMLNCAHRVNMETGETQEPGANPCPYLQAKWEVISGKDDRITLTTTAWLFMNRLFAQLRDMEPGGIVVDEGHNLAGMARQLLENRITDWHLWNMSERLAPYEPEEAEKIRLFGVRMYAVARRHEGATEARPALLREDDIRHLLELAVTINPDRIEAAIQRAIEDGAIDPEKNRRELKSLEAVVYGVKRMVRMLEYAVAEEAKATGGRARNPLNFVIAFHFEDDDPGFAPGGKRKAATVLVVKSYFVQPALRKTLGHNLLVMSATIGDGRVFGWETGLMLDLLRFPSAFDVRNRGVFMPVDAVDTTGRGRVLKDNARLKGRVRASEQTRRKACNKALRQMIASALRFKERGVRCLAVVQSNRERDFFERYGKQSGLEVVSYGNGRSAKEAAAEFKEGAGDVLVGTAAQYGEGLDLPDRITEVVLFLRPGYPPLDSPQSQFEKRRFRRDAWKLWQWRVMVQALQVAGRNIRTANDKGALIVFSYSFERWLYASLPEWLRPAYRKGLTLEECVEATLDLLGKSDPSDKA